MRRARCCFGAAGASQDAASSARDAPVPQVRKMLLRAPSPLGCPHLSPLGCPHLPSGTPISPRVSPSSIRYPLIPPFSAHSLPTFGGFFPSLLPGGESRALPELRGILGAAASRITPTASFPSPACPASFPPHPPHPRRVPHPSHRILPAPSREARALLPALPIHAGAGSVQGSLAEPPAGSGGAQRFLEHTRGSAAGSQRC